MDEKGMVSPPLSPPLVLIVFVSVMLSPVFDCCMVYGLLLVCFCIDGLSNVHHSLWHNWAVGTDGFQGDQRTLFEGDRNKYGREKGEERIG
jgi:hypothetical protein